MHNTFCHENNEEFKIGTYNGVSIIYRVSDNYVNAGKLCRDANKRIFDFTRREKWNEIVNYWIKHEQNDVGGNSLLPLIELKKGYPKARGIYIHPDLVHFITEWISIEYSFMVKRIMNLINDRNRILNKCLKDTILELQDKLDEALDEIKSKNKQLNESNETIVQKNCHIAETSVPITNCTKKLYILYHGDDHYKLCADSTNKPPQELIFKEYHFSASMNYKQEIGKLAGLKKPEYIFHNDRLKEIIDIILNYKPKKKNKIIVDLLDDPEKFFEGVWK